MPGTPAPTALPGPGTPAAGPGPEDCPTGITPDLAAAGQRQPERHRHAGPGERRADPNASAPKSAPRKIWPTTATPLDRRPGPPLRPHDTVTIADRLPVVRRLPLPRRPGDPAPRHDTTTGYDLALITTDLTSPATPSWPATPPAGASRSPSKTPNRSPASAKPATAPPPPCNDRPVRTDHPKPRRHLVRPARLPPRRRRPPPSPGPLVHHQNPTRLPRHDHQAAPHPDRRQFRGGRPDNPPPRNHCHRRSLGRSRRLDQQNTKVEAVRNSSNRDQDPLVRRGRRVGANEPCNIVTAAE